MEYISCTSCHSNAPLLKKYEQASSHLKNTAELRQCTEYAALFAEVNALKEAISILVIHFKAKSVMKRGR